MPRMRLPRGLRPWLCLLRGGGAGTTAPGSWRLVQQRACAGMQLGVVRQDDQDAAEGPAAQHHRACSSYACYIDGRREVDGKEALALCTCHAGSMRMWPPHI